jgi:hypothetical protein
MTAAWTTSQEISAFGYNANAVRIRNVGVAVDATDAARKGDTDALDSRVAALEAQAATFASFGTVAFNGTIEGGSGDYVLVKQGVGTYQLTFTEAASATNDQSLAVTLRGLAPGFIGATVANVWFDSPTVARVFLLQDDTPDPVLVDAAFTFQRLAN